MFASLRRKPHLFKAITWCGTALGNRHVWFGGLDRLDESAQGRVSPYGALAVSVRTPSLSEMTRMANSDGLNGESVETAAYANAPRRSV